MTLETRIAELEEAVASLKARLPRHSTPPGMLIELEDMEDELAALLRQAETKQRGETQLT